MRTDWPLKGLARPAQRALAAASIVSLDDLAAKSEAELAALHGMGPRAIDLLKKALQAEGRAFRRTP